MNMLAGVRFLAWEEHQRRGQCLPVYAVNCCPFLLQRLLLRSCRRLCSRARQGVSNGAQAHRQEV